MGRRVGSPPGEHRGDAGVSPVIGMILILAISVLGIVAVTNWGLPAIREMQASTQLRATLDEFHDLDSSLQRLMSGTTGQTTVKWQPTFSQGALDVNTTGDRWLVAADVANPDNKAIVRWFNFGNEDNSFTVDLSFEAPSTQVTNYRFRAWQWSGGAATELKVNTANDCSTPLWGAAQGPAQITYYLRTNATVGCQPVTMRNAVLSFAINSETALGVVTPVHMAFLADVGHIHWNSLEGARAPKHVYSTNGAVFAGASDSLLPAGSLPIAPPRNFTNSTGVGSTSIFVRLLKVNGTASFSSAVGGQEHYSLYLGFEGTYTMGQADNVTAAYVYVSGPAVSGPDAQKGQMQEPTYAALKERAAGYYFDDGTVGGQAYVTHKEGKKPFKFSLVYTLLKVES